MTVNKASDWLIHNLGTVINDSNTLLLTINGNCMEFCFIYMVWWFFEIKAFCALRKKAKIGKLQRLKMDLGMSNIELK